MALEEREVLPDLPWVQLYSEWLLPTSQVLLQARAQVLRCDCIWRQGFKMDDEGK